jgi:16S rRNA U516 pseudouridylate synthase RsuA-like enzyme
VRHPALAALRVGVDLEDGRTAPAQVRKLAWDTLELTIREGRNRQVKRMCEHVGHRVRGLTRTAFGPLTLGDMRSGAARRLTEAEMTALTSAGRATLRRPLTGSQRVSGARETPGTPLS